MPDGPHLSISVDVDLTATMVRSGGAEVVNPNVINDLKNQRGTIGIYL